jgi:hypothetical protein
MKTLQMCSIFFSNNVFKTLSRQEDKNYHR